ncbi:MAG: hypothetical protein AAFY51_13065, partial [Pseudomonadota bacterium]
MARLVFKLHAAVFLNHQIASQQKKVCGVVRPRYQRPTPLLSFHPDFSSSFRFNRMLSLMESRPRYPSAALTPVNLFFPQIVR